MCLFVPLSQQNMTNDVANVGDADMKLSRCVVDPKFKDSMIRILNSYSGQNCHTHLWHRKWCDITQNGL